MPFARRSFLQSMFGGLGLMSAIPATGHAAEDSQPFVAAFLTDTHLPAGKPEVAERVAGLIDSIQSRQTAPQLFIFGGDNIFAVDGNQSNEQTDEQFRLWNENVMSRLKCPSVSVIGNHDIRWKERVADKPEEYLEKARATATYKMPSRYYRKEHGGWTFLLLDVFQHSGCELDAAQWSWLKEQLQQGDTPVCVVTHAPLMSATHFLEPSTDRGKGYSIPSGWSPQGLTKFRTLFQEHPRVKLCLSGHMHTCDRVEIDETAYVCGGAVSGNWWHQADYLGFGPTWIELQLYPDGRWTHTRQKWS